MAFSINSITEHPVETPVASQNTLPSAELTLLMAGALAGASMTKSAKKQYRKMARKAAFVLAGLKLKRMFGLKKKSGDVPDEILGLNFWVFLAIVVVGAALGAWIFGFLGFIILVALAFIIYLLLKDDGKLNLKV